MIFRSLALMGSSTLNTGFTELVLIVFIEDFAFSADRYAVYLLDFYIRQSVLSFGEILHHQLHWLLREGVAKEYFFGRLAQCEEEVDIPHRYYPVALQVVLLFGQLDSRVLFDRQVQEMLFFL